jgi:hypothetical protein
MTARPHRRARQHTRRLSASEKSAAVAGLHKGRTASSRAIIAEAPASAHLSDPTACR